jgi:hypothetical protein
MYALISHHNDKLRHKPSLIAIFITKYFSNVHDDASNLNMLLKTMKL